MAKFNLDNIADLARQLAFTPHDARLAQLAAAEDLLLSLDASRGYPLDFVVFRITGFHPHRVDEDALLAGSALQHDLGLLIERVSESLDTATSEFSEPVLAIDDVAEKFNVTSKTIQRWRRRGLPARRFVFPDGRRRIGFRLNCVERFLIAHRDVVSPETKLTQIDAAEHEVIVRNARRLVAQRCTEAEIARRIGRRLNRSPLAILHTLRKSDEASRVVARALPLTASRDVEAELSRSLVRDAASGATPILDRCPATLDEETRHRMLRGHRRGQPLSQIAARFDRSRSEVGRVIIDERVAKLNRRKIHFIDDELYHQPDAESAVDTMVSAARAALPAKSETIAQRPPRDLPPYVAELFRTPLLSPVEERALFLKFNLRKFRFVEARTRLDPQFARRLDLSVLEKALREAVATKNEIVRANLRLVVSVARKHLRPNLSLMELISDGNLTLMRAVESFDVHKGYRFSTYATLALMKGFARSVPQMQADIAGAKWLRSNVEPRQNAAAPDQSNRNRAPRREAMFPEDLADARQANVPQAVGTRDEVRTLMSKLDDREQAVLLAHFGLNSNLASPNQRGDEAPIPYDQIAGRLGISTQRVRQIERRALDKLRAIAGTTTQSKLDFF